MTNDLLRRTLEHKEKVNKGFSNKYNINKLVYYEATTEVYSAITREKQLKRWSHKKKRTLVTLNNPKWKDLSKELF
jgi:putative endonuclease